MRPNVSLDRKGSLGPRPNKRGGSSASLLQRNKTNGFKKSQFNLKSSVNNISNISNKGEDATKEKPSRQLSPARQAEARYRKLYTGIISGTGDMSEYSKKINRADKELDGTEVADAEGDITPVNQLSILAEMNVLPKKKFGPSKTSKSYKPILFDGPKKPTEDLGKDLEQLVRGSQKSIASYYGYKQNSVREQSNMFYEQNPDQLDPNDDEELNFYNLNKERPPCRNNHGINDRCVECESVSIQPNTLGRHSPLRPQDTVENSKKETTMADRFGFSAESFPARITQTPKGLVVDVSFNNMNELKDTSSWPTVDVRAVIAAHNNLKSIRPLNIYPAAKTITILDLSHNSISFIDREVQMTLAGLTSLALAYNKFTSFPVFENCIPNLNVLNLIGNCIVYLPSYVAKMKLKKLFLDWKMLKLPISELYKANFPNELNNCNMFLNSEEIFHIFLQASNLQNQLDNSVSGMYDKSRRGSFALSYWDDAHKGCLPDHVDGICYSFSPPEGTPAGVSIEAYLDNQLLKMSNKRYLNCCSVACENKLNSVWKYMINLKPEVLSQIYLEGQVPLIVQAFKKNFEPSAVEYFITHFWAETMKGVEIYHPVHAMIEAG